MGDLSAFCTEHDLHVLFSKFGRIELIEIKRSRETNESLLHGFVEYASKSSANLAINSMQGFKFKGRRMR